MDLLETIYSGLRIHRLKNKSQLQKKGKSFPGLHIPRCQLVWSRMEVAASINFKSSLVVPIMKIGLRTTGLVRLDDL